ncbi:putative pectate lyase 3 [Stylosanthes scabra]|uniref:Pectate lyase n=1 Tax=Stylosanthes scabra TaxID=79078 RepID=A0ABU6W8F5_9FABA|nr:putative pectate lyase 3 [Stylosanthes scabra]
MAKAYTLFLSLCLVVVIPTLQANILENSTTFVEQHIGTVDDAYWKERASVARKLSENAYFPDPHALTRNFTLTVQQDIAASKKVRRSLSGKQLDGPCEATNPIDRCWRCDPNWESNRQKLADCVQGFGRKTTGGKGGPIYVVTDPSDHDMVNPKPGTLRHAVTRNGPLWITFSHSMSIRLNEELMVSSNKTIDGRGVDVYIIKGAGITVQYVNNVIIHGIKIRDIVPGNGGFIRDSEDHYGFRTRSDGDGISIFGASNVWVDHVSMRKCSDGIIDAIMGSTAITISNSHFTDHNDVMLFGANKDHTIDKVMQITLAFNHFGKRLIQRMPRCRYGFVHVVNNDYTHWEMYAIGGSEHPTIISEGNRFVAPDDNNAKEITKRVTNDDWKDWQWRSTDDVFENGAFFVQSGPEMKTRPFGLKDMITPKPGSYVQRLTRYAGSLKCRVGEPC